MSEYTNYELGIEQYFEYNNSLTISKYNLLKKNLEK